SVVGHDHVVDGAGGNRGPSFTGLRGRPKKALHGHGHRIPQTVPLENRLRAFTPRSVKGRRTGADVIDRIPNDIRPDATARRGAARRGPDVTRGRAGSRSGEGTGSLGPRGVLSQAGGGGARPSTCPSTPFRSRGCESNVARLSESDFPKPRGDRRPGARPP